MGECGGCEVVLDEGGAGHSDLAKLLADTIGGPAPPWKGEGGLALSN